MKYLLILLSLFVFSQANAESIQSTKAAEIISSADIIKLFVSLFLVVLLILFFSYLFKRLSGISTNDNTLIKVVSSRMIGTKEKLMVVSIEDRNFLIGVTSGSINKISEVSLKKTVNDEKDGDFLISFKKYISREKE